MPSTPRPLRFITAAIAPVLALAPLLLASDAGAVVPAPAVAAANVLPVVTGQSGPLGDLTVTESIPGQIHVGDVFTYTFEDATNASTLHFSTAGTVSGTNGLAATVALASSNISGPPLNDQMKVTISSVSSASAFPGVLTLSGLTAVADGAAAIGNDKVVISDSLSALSSPVTVADARLLSSGTLRASYVALATPTIIPTLAGQAVGQVDVTEPAKSFFQTGDVITFTIRDVNGSADTIGLASTPYAAGGSMTVSVSGVNGPTVQVNDTSFNVNVVAADPSQGSASTITVSNLVVNTAEAPLGPVTLSAVVSSGPDTGVGFITPGRVAIASVGGNTTTTASAAPVIAKSTNLQPAGNVTITATPGSLSHDDLISLHIQAPGVTFSAGAAPIATVTTGSVVFTNAQATLDGTDTTATWKVANGDSILSTIVVGPIYYDVSGAATAGQPVTVLASAQAGSAFTAQVVTNAQVASAATGIFTTVPAEIPSIASAPFTGANITFKESGAGAIPVGASVVVLSPYATQIAAYRSTFSAVPVVAGTNGLVFSTPHVNSSALVIATAQGQITAPAQSAAIVTVTSASTSAATITISSLAYSLGDLVAPGTLVATGVIEQPGALTTALSGNSVVDLINTRNLGTSAATTPPVATFTQTPPLFTNLTTATFAFNSDQFGSTFACALDAIVISLTCPSPLTLPSLATGTHTFTIQAINIAGYSTTPVSYTWTIDSLAPTATVTAPSSVNGPVTVTFSEPVTGISLSTVTLGATADPNPPVAVPLTLTCTPAAGPAGACDPTAPYASIVAMPTSTLVPGQIYVFTLNPALAAPPIADAASNPLVLSTTSFRGPLNQEETSPAGRPKWASVNNASASGSNYAVAHLAGASAIFTFTGTAVTWNTVTGPSQGKASVYVDNVLKLSVNNFASAPHFHVARTVSGLSAGPHTLRVVVLGQKGLASATDCLVAVDSFTVASIVSEQSAASVSYAWSSVASPSASGGHYGIDDLANSKFSLNFVGTGVTWLTVTGPNMGEAQVLIDGVLKATVNNYAANATYKVARNYGSLTAGTHTITIVVLGKHVTTSSSNRIAVDALRVA